MQNADDAGATRVAFILDERTHGAARLGGLGNVGALQGPALLCYDDAVFKEENFDGLFRFGVGSKRGDPTQTGRFGLGFNAVPLCVASITNHSLSSPRSKFLSCLSGLPPY